MIGEITTKVAESVEHITETAEKVREITEHSEVLESTETGTYRDIKPENPNFEKDADKFWNDVFSNDLFGLNEDDTGEYSDLDSMKKDLGKTYGEMKEDKPPNSPNIAKWFDNGGSIRIEKVDGKQIWAYLDNVGREVPYIDGYPQFPPEAKSPVIDDINIGRFTGDRNEDKKIYLQKLEDQYGLTEIPDGYALHHDSKNGNMQLVRIDWHKEFTHAGGHSLFKER